MGDDIEILEGVEDDYSDAFTEEAEGTVTVEVKVEQEPEENTAGAGVVSGEPDDKPDQLEPDDELTGTDKALRDTQAWGTKLSQENADLKRQLEELRLMRVSDEHQDEPLNLLAELDLTEGERDLLESDPELGGIVGKMAAFFQKAITSSPAANNQTVDTLTSQIDQMRFSNTLIGGGFDANGNYIEGHADGIKVAVSPEFRSYWAAKGVNIDTITDPVQSIKMIGDYKESLIKKAVAVHDEKQHLEADNLNNMATGLTSGRGVELGQGDSDDYNAAFAEEAAAGL